jgi:CheY-like chemotaxis protein
VPARQEPRNPTVSLRILIVESDPAAREFLRTCLTEDGHQVAVAGNGAEAISWCRTSDSPLDVLVTDLFLPDVNALEIATLLREQSPETGLVLLSDVATSSTTGRRMCPLWSGLSPPRRCCRPLVGRLPQERQHRSSTFRPPCRFGERDTSPAH